MRVDHSIWRENWTLCTAKAGSVRLSLCWDSPWPRKSQWARLSTPSSHTEEYTAHLVWKRRRDERERQLVPVNRIAVKQCSDGGVSKVCRWLWLREEGTVLNKGLWGRKEQRARGQQCTTILFKVFVLLGFRCLSGGFPLFLRPNLDNVVVNRSILKSGRRRRPSRPRRLCAA